MESKACTWVILFLLFMAELACGQEKPVPIEGKAVYFDVSPPFRNLQACPSSRLDQTWKEGAVPNHFKSYNFPGIPEEGINDTLIQRYNGRIFPDTVIRNFDGLGNVNHASPPDTYGDVGPAHYVQIVNLSFAIYDKSGVKLLGPFNTSSIWEGMPNNTNWGDGIVLYDEMADRWLISQFSFPNFPMGPFYEMVAVSQTPDPTGAWYRWEFAFGDLPDYPKFGIWPDGYYMSFTRLKPQTLQRDGVGAIVFNRNAMLSGDPAPASIQFNITGAESPFIFLPSDCDGPFPPDGTPNYFGCTVNGFFVLREFHTDWTNTASSSFGNILKLPVSPYSSVGLGGVPQKGSEKLLSVLDERLMYRFQFRKFSDHQSMVVNHTVGVDGHSGIRWYELRKTTGNWFVNQQSTWAPDSLFRWMGSIAMDSSGNMALGYSVSSSSIYPSVRFTGRMSHDPPGQMTIGETRIVDGAGCQTGSWSGQNRWGDYSSMTVDPAAPSTFWYTQEYYAATSVDNWSTRIASFSFSRVLDLDATASPPEVCAGGSARLDVEVQGGSETCTYLWSSDPPGFNSDEKSPTISPATTATYIVHAFSGSQVKTDSVVVPVIPGPSAFAGNDTVICRYVNELPVSGRVSNCHTVKWGSSGDGYFSEPDALNTLYHPGMYDKLSDKFILKLTAYPSAACLPVSAIQQVVIDTCTGMYDPSADPFQVRLHPNPVHDRLTLEVTRVFGHEMTITLFNPPGETLCREVINTAGQAFTREIDTSGLKKGVYYLRMQTSSDTMVVPFVVQ